MANKIYVNDETTLSWLSSTGTEVITLTSLAAGAGRQGALHAFGTAARAREYTWRAFVLFATTPVVGEVIDIYWKSAEVSNAHPDNDDGTGDAAVSAEDKLRNLTWIGNIVVDEASTTPEFVGSSMAGQTLNIDAANGAPVFWNRTADALSATALDHGFHMTPVPSEVQ